MPGKRGHQEPDSKVDKPARKRIARRLRDALAQRSLTITQMVEVLGADEPTVLLALRRLRKSGKAKAGKAGRKRSGAAGRTNRLRSGMVAGRPCWWWKPDESGAAEPPPDSEDE